MNKISAATITKNAESDIRDWLEAIKWVDEIVVLDRMSDDKTVEICKEYSNLKLEIGKKDDLFGPLRNYVLSKTTGEWVLWLNTDEIITPQLEKEIREAIKDETKSGYYFSRHNMFLGKWIKGCGWWPNNVIRLFRNGAAEFPEDIHDSLKILDKSRIGYLKSPLIHNSYTSLEQYFTKFNFYTSELAREEFKKGIRISFLSFPVLFLLKPIYWFLQKYFLQNGWKFGFRGFFISFSSALVIFITYAKLWEKENNL